MSAPYSGAHPPGRLLLWGLQSPINVGMILRVAEGFQLPVLAYDPHGVLRRPDTRDTVSEFACGALERAAPTLIAPPASPDGARAACAPGRLIATCLHPDAAPLTALQLQPLDTFAFGAEYDGLPEALIENADAAVTIPMPRAFIPKPTARDPIDPDRDAPVNANGRPNLNVAAAAAIVCEHIYRTGRAAHGGPVASSPLAHDP